MILSDDSITLPTSGSTCGSESDDSSMEKDRFEVLVSNSSKALVQDARNDQELRLTSTSELRTNDFRDIDRLPEHAKSVAAKIHKKNSYESAFRQEESCIDSRDDLDNILRNLKGNRTSIVQSSYRPLHRLDPSKSRRAYYNSLERRAKNRSKLSRKEKENMHVPRMKQNIQNKSSSLRLKSPKKTRLQVTTKNTPKREKSQDTAVFSRLYMRSQRKQEEGKQRRHQIEEMRKERERSRTEVFHQPTKKISVARASQLYYRGMEKKISLERRIAESKEKRSTIPYKSYLLQNTVSPLLSRRTF